MATEKLTIKKIELEQHRAHADLANVKIISETDFGEDVILSVRFRQPANLYTWGKYIHSNVKKLEPKQTKKAK